MFNWLKPNPVKSLEKEHEKKLEQAFLAQRNGKIELYADLTKECNELQKKIDALKAEAKSS